MPLVLSLRAGQDFYVDDVQVVVAQVRRDHSFQLKLRDKTYLISDAEAVEILPDVYVHAGGRPQFGVARIAIEAPMERKLERGDRYRGEAKEPVHVEARVTRVNPWEKWK